MIKYNKLNTSTVESFSKLILQMFHDKIPFEFLFARKQRISNRINLLCLFMLDANNHDDFEFYKRLKIKALTIRCWNFEFDDRQLDSDEHVEILIKNLTVKNEINNGFKIRHFRIRYRILTSPTRQLEHN